MKNFYTISLILRRMISCRKYRSNPELNLHEFYRSSRRFGDIWKHAMNLKIIRDSVKLFSVLDNFEWQKGDDR